MTQDIVERLWEHNVQCGNMPDDPDTLVGEAATLIEQLRAENDRLREALTIAIDRMRYVGDQITMKRISERLEDRGEELRAALAAQQKEVG